MFKYIPHTEEDIKAMLARIGVTSIDDLFESIPKEIKKNKPFNLPHSMSEIELRKQAKIIESKNQTLLSFLGAGSYDGYIPSVTKALVSRQEFLTSYTPYQPEISQGTLQYIFEFQSIICELTGMDVANASVYDGATGTAEAMFMAYGQTRRSKVLLSETMNPRVIEVVKTYAKYRGLELIMIPAKEDALDQESLLQAFTPDVSCVMVQSPNYYGVVEDYQGLAEIIHANKSLFILNTDPSTLSVLESPRELGFDIVVGDAQTLGIPMSFGGPYLGFLATTTALVRKMPGRIAGLTTDVDGRRGFVLTLQAREQHIRREKANSNICSNQSLMALQATIYVAVMGADGLEEMAKRAYQNAHYLYQKCLALPFLKPANQQVFFKEFVVVSDIDLGQLNEYLLSKGYLGGLNLGNGRYLLCATEMRTKEEIDAFVACMEEFTHVR